MKNTKICNSAREIYTYATPSIAGYAACDAAFLTLNSAQTAQPLTRARWKVYLGWNRLLETIVQGARPFGNLMDAYQPHVCFKSINTRYWKVRPRSMQKRAARGNRERRPQSGQRIVDNAIRAGTINWTSEFHQRSDSFAEHWTALPRSLRVSGFSIRIKDFAVGSDADNVIFDSEKEHTFRRRKRAHECPLCVLRRLENEG